MSKKGTKSCLENSILKITEMASVSWDWEIYDFVALEKCYRLTYKVFLELSWMDLYRPTRQQAEPIFPLTYHRPSVKWYLEDNNKLFQWTCSYRNRCRMECSIRWNYPESKTISLYQDVSKISHEFDSHFDDGKIRVLFWVHITLDSVESTWNYYQTTQRKILHRSIHDF